jgi:signal transduction histidine kinase/DNA-binding response OmpR family regulator
MEDKEENIWMGTKKDGLILLKKKDNHSYQLQQFIHQPENTYSLSNNSVYSIIQDNRGNIWIACYGGGLNLLSKTHNGSINFIHSGNRLKNYPVSTALKIRHIAEAPDGVLLIGTTNGLLTFSNKFDQPEEIKFYHSNRIPNVDSSLSSNDVMQIFTDSRKNTYVITFTGGISQVISKNLLTEDIKFKSYTIKDGLASDLVLSMLEDTQKQLWVISENSISKFNPEQGTFENYGNNYFQRELNLTEAVPALTGQNRIVLGTNQGILEINTEQMKKSSYVPPIVFTGLKIQGSQLHVALDDIQELELEPSERNVTFQFAAIDYVNPDAIEYAYRLQGLEEEWNEAGKNRSATYINLPAGEYQLQIRSSNSDGVWTDNIRTLPIHVLPTFWETYWAWIFYIVMFILFTTIIVYILFYIYRLRHQVDLEQHLSNIKLRFFTDISHELRTPLTLISSPVSEILEHEVISSRVREHLNLVHKNTERMLRLVNQLLDFRKIQNKKMKVLIEKTELVSLLQKIMENFHLIAQEKKIDFQLHTDTDPIYAWVDRDKFEKIFFNLLSNAFKYTPNGKKVTINLITDSTQVTISVSDEGIGIAPEKQQSLFYRFETLAQYNILQPSSGIGLSLVRELIELHHGNIQVKSEPGSGSEFIVTFPKEEKVFKDDEQAEFILSDSDHISSTMQVAAVAAAKEEDPGTTISSETTYMENENKTDENDDRTSILIVEDNNELRHFLWNILSETYTVFEATNGEEGLKYAQQHIPDLIISDVMMPVMDGLDMVKTIKADHDTCHIPIIILSAKSSLDDRIAGLEQGIDDYITKPFSSTYLKTRILSLLRQRKQLQDLYLSKLAEHTQEENNNINEWEPSQPQVTPYDEQFMQQVMSFMEEQMDNTDITIDDFANKLMLSRTVFYRKLKSIVGLTPVDFVCEMRIKRAAQLIERSEYSFSQIAYMTGFSDPKYFSRRFKKIMGVTPTEYKEKEGDGLKAL